MFTVILLKRISGTSSHSHRRRLRSSPCPFASILPPMPNSPVINCPKSIPPFAVIVPCDTRPCKNVIIPAAVSSETRDSLFLSNVLRELISAVETPCDVLLLLSWIAELICSLTLPIIESICSLDLFCAIVSFSDNSTEISSRILSSDFLE